MSERVFRILPWLALVGLLVAALCVVAGIPPAFRAARTETGQTRAVVEESLSAHVAAPVVAPEYPALLQGLVWLQQTPYVAGVWLFTADGRLIRASGSTAAAYPNGLHRLPTRHRRDAARAQCPPGYLAVPRPAAGDLRGRGYPA